jgi:putative aldouronate transport system substrate-binding protein
MKTKKILSIIPAVTMLIGAALPGTAFAEQNSVADAYGWTVPDETLEISVFYASDNFSVGEEAERGIADMQAYLLENFNIDYQIRTTDGEADEELNLMLASGDYPDVIIGASTTMRQRFVSQGRVADLTEYLTEDVSPNLVDRLGDLIGLYADEDGKYYYLPSTYSNLMDLPDYTAHLRLDEMEEAGIDYSTIETPEDFFEAAMAIYNANPVTEDGETRYSLGLYSQGMPEYLSGYWGLMRGWQINDDNTLTYWTHTDAGKKMAAYFNNWWRTGTMDPDSFTNAWSDLKTKVSQKRIVSLIGGWWIGLNGGSEVWKSTDEDWTSDETYVCIGFKDEDAESSNATVKNNAGSTWTFITDKCEDVAGVMQWLDFVSTDLGTVLTNWGMPNEVESYENPGTYTTEWTLEDDGTWYINPDAKEQLITETWDYNEAGIYGGDSGVFATMAYQGRFADGVHCLWLNQMWYSENAWKSIMLENMQDTITDGTALLFESLTMSDDVTLAKTAVEDAWKQYYPLVVMSATDEEFEQNWANLQAAVEAAGLDTYTEYRTENYQANLELMGE